MRLDGFITTGYPALRLRAERGRHARPIFHQLWVWDRAHLNIVFAALAISCEAQQRTRCLDQKIINTLRPLRTATVTVGGHQITAVLKIPRRRTSC